MSDEKECEICACEFDNGNHVPRLLPCTHTVCTRCLQQLVNGNKVQCPFDRVSYFIRNGDVTGLPVNTRFMSEYQSADITEQRNHDDPSSDNHIIRDVRPENSQERWRTQLPPVYPSIQRHSSYPRNDGMSFSFHISDNAEQISRDSNGNRGRNGRHYRQNDAYRSDVVSNRRHRRQRIDQQTDRREGQRLTLPPISQRYGEVITKAAHAVDFMKNLANRIPRCIQNRDVRDPPYRQIQKVFVNIFNS